jgi:hypothetical protein
LDLSLLPLLVINGRVVYDRGDLPTDPLRLCPSCPPTTYGAIYDEAYRLNRDYFNRMRIDYRNPALEGEYREVVGLTRMFKQSGVGRWFQKGGLSYQELPKQDRAELALDGEPVTELDYPAMHLTSCTPGRACSAPRASTRQCRICAGARGSWPSR